MIETLKDYKLGDMIAHYTIDENKIAGFILLPDEVGVPQEIDKKAAQENMVQIKYAGDIYNEAYAGGLTMRNSESARRLLYDRQEMRIFQWICIALGVYGVVREG